VSSLLFQEEPISVGSSKRMSMLLDINLLADRSNFCVNNESPSQSENHMLAMPFPFLLKQLNSPLPVLTKLLQAPCHKADFSVNIMMNKESDSTFQLSRFEDDGR
jgi:hypothetical protein